MNDSSKYKLHIAYDGTRFSGWQVQPNATSIQTLVETSLSTILGKPTTVVGAGRTDAKVHALEQIAHFETEKEPNLPRLIRSLNGLLPIDIRINSIEKVASNFHARYSASGKIYHYHLDIGIVQNPFKRLYAYHFSYPFNLDLLKEASNLFIGTHDFTSFSNEAERGSASNDPIRTLKRLDIRENKEQIILEFEGNGFLYKMVRNITGTLLDIARGKIPLDDLPSIFEEKDRRKAGTCAPAHGLFLIKVLYP